MISDNIKQRDIEWYRSRLGHFTGSRISDLLKSGRKKEQVFGDTALSYIYKVAAERMINPAFVNDDDVFLDYLDQMQTSSKAIRWGQDHEEEAKGIIKRLHPDWEISDLSSCKHDTIKFYAASPDGLIYDRKEQMIVEVKCPNPDTHIKYVSCIKDNDTLKATKPEYYYQMQAEMDCTNTPKGMFVSYCPWLTHPIHIVPIARDEEAITLIQSRVKQANELVEDIINKATSSI